MCWGLFAASEMLVRGDEKKDLVVVVVVVKGEFLGGGEAGKNADGVVQGCRSVGAAKWIGLGPRFSTGTMLVPLLLVCILLYGV